ncbi:Glycogenin-1 [Cichlidogyrus casuarinus]|uniref:glycogenin glucosyltransferase n=1 Tax=Cichlidogyrus casuarinus TaxID=1844966 RepID=A0ABD2PX36_9PLAT
MEAFVTLATSDEYAVGAMVLARSLRSVQTTRQLVCMVTDNLASEIKLALNQVFDLVQIVNILDSKDADNLRLLARPDLGVTFTKLHCWRLTQYSKCVFMDADTLALQNIDDLFDREELSASPDPGWPDYFNSGVFVFRPSLDTYDKLINHALSTGSFDGGDQGLLNTFFSEWSVSSHKRLPVAYNCMSVSFYSYLPAFLQHKQHIRVAHFIGSLKPWHQQYCTQSGSVVPRDDNGKFTIDFLNKWWTTFVTEVRPLIGSQVTGFVGQMVNKPYEAPAQAEPHEGPSPVQRQMAWERGEIDYTGSDSFDNIAAKLDSVIKK